MKIAANKQQSMFAFFPLRSQKANMMVSFRSLSLPKKNHGNGTNVCHFVSDIHTQRNRLQVGRFNLFSEI